MSHDISFKPLKKEDLRLLYNWFLLPHVQSWYCNNKEYTYQLIKDEYLLKVNSPEKNTNFLVNIDGDAKAYIQYYKVTDALPDGISNHKHPMFKAYPATDMVGIDMFIADNALLHQGMGSEILELFIAKYIKGKFKYIIVDPKSDNIRSINFFKKNGFKDTNFITTDSKSVILILRL